jgi:hypothetical protein
MREKWKEWIFLLLLSSLERYNSVNNLNGGFCNLNHHENSHFPLPPPERHIPWIWDAVLIPKQQIVELTMISRNACRFNKTTWKTIVNRYPQIANQLGEGKDENIYVDVDPSFDYARFNRGFRGEIGKGLQMSYCQCVYLNDQVEVARVRSWRIDDVEIAELSSLQIRCPLPFSSSSFLEWNQMRVERILSHLPEERYLPNSSLPFTVCRDSTHLPSALVPKNITHQGGREGSGGGEAEDEYQYDLTLCAATSRTYRPHLVEWLEYHLMLGIQHFYLYDTTLWNHPIEKSLHHTLQDYILRGVVTVIRWPYENCVKQMASGRWVNYLTQDAHGVQENKFFNPPRAIAQTAALASCYSRFKRKTKWMTHIDDDEFLVSSVYLPLTVSPGLFSLSLSLIPPGV